LKKQPSKSSRTPSTNARYFKSVVIPGSNKSVRVACYEPRDGSNEAKVTLAIGPATPPNSFAKASAIIDDNTWKQITGAVEAAMQAKDKSEEST
jgi:hypothetical protein